MAACCKSWLQESWSAAYDFSPRVSLVLAGVLGRSLSLDQAGQLLLSLGSFLWPPSHAQPQRLHMTRHESCPSALAMDQGMQSVSQRVLVTGSVHLEVQGHVGMVPDGSSLLVVLLPNGHSQLALEQLQRLRVLVPAAWAAVSLCSRPLLGSHPGTQCECLGCMASLKVCSALLLLN